MRPPSQKEYWQRVWSQALANMPVRLSKDATTHTSVAARYHVYGAKVALAKCLSVKTISSTPLRNLNFIQFNKYPRNKEVRRKLELCAGPYGKILAWQKLKELGLAEKYQKT